MEEAGGGEEDKRPSWSSSSSSSLPGSLSASGSPNFFSLASLSSSPPSNWSITPLSISPGRLTSASDSTEDTPRKPTTPRGGIDLIPTKSEDGPRTGNPAPGRRRRSISQGCLQPILASARHPHTRDSASLTEALTLSESHEKPRSMRRKDKIGTGEN